MTVIQTREHAPQLVRSGSAPARPVPAAAAGLTGRDFLRILHKRKWLIILCTLGFTALGIVGKIVWATYAPLYTSEGLIEVVPPRQVGTTDAPMFPQEIMERLTVQAARLIQLQTVLDGACEDERLKHTMWFEKSKTDAAKRLGEDVDVLPIPKTNLIRVSMTGMAQGELPEIVNSLIDAAVKESTRNRQEQRTAELNKLNDQIKDFTRQYDDNRREANALLTDSTIASLKGRVDSLASEMNALVPKLLELQLAQANAKEQLDMTRKQYENGTLAQAPEVMQSLDNDGTLRSLKMAEANWATDLDDAMKNKGLSHPVVKRLENRLISVRQQIKDRTAELVDSTAKGLVGFREQQDAAATAQLTKIRTQYNQADASARDVQGRITRLGELDTQAKYLNDQIDKFRNRITDVNLMTSLEPPIRQASLARRSIEPSQPQWKIMIPAGVGLGLLLGFGLTLLLELMDTSIKGPSDIVRRVDLPMLGMIPHGEDMSEEIPDMRTAFATHPNSLVGEAFRQVRTCLLFSGPAHQHRSLLVTSPMPEDGRTTVALNLAAAMARGGRRVLVVDANFRQPILKRLFPQLPDGGLSSALVGQEPWQNLVAQIEPNLSVLAAGPLPPNPAELLGSEPMRQLIAEMVGQYDQVIFDGAPCLVVSDMAVLSTLVDGVVLAVRAGTNTYGIVQRSRDMFSRLGAHILGVVLNGVRVTAGGYLRKSYETFYEYHGQQTQLPVK